MVAESASLSPQAVKVGPPVQRGEGSWEARWPRGVEARLQRARMPKGLNLFGSNRIFSPEELRFV